MCKLLNLPRSLVYYKRKQRHVDSTLENELIKIFRNSKNNYGARKIKIELKKVNLIASYRRIRTIMKKYHLVSSYTVKQYKVHNSSCNNEKVGNIVNREFSHRNDFKVVVSDLTYVRVKDQWNYISLLINLYNREIVGFSVGTHKTSELVYEAFINSPINLSKIGIFLTDRGSEFENKVIDDILAEFEIKCSLSHKGCPYNNVIAESTYKIIKTEFVKHRIFESL